MFWNILFPKWDYILHCFFYFIIFLQNNFYGIYRVSQNVCAPLKVQIERNLTNKNDLSTIGSRSLDHAQINNNVKPIRTQETVSFHPFGKYLSKRRSQGNTCCKKWVFSYYFTAGLWPSKPLGRCSPGTKGLKFSFGSRKVERNGFLSSDWLNVVVNLRLI